MAENQQRNPDQPAEDDPPGPAAARRRFDVPRKHDRKQHQHQDAAYASCIVRSQDLIHWESSPYNPIMEFSDEDRRIANANLNAEERQRIATAYNRNNSDVDLCEFNSHVVIYYSWGDQLGIEHLAEAVYQGTLESFLRGFFPE